MARKSKQNEANGAAYLAEFFGATCVEDVCATIRKAWGPAHEINDAMVDGFVEMVGRAQVEWDALIDRASRNADVSKALENTGYIRMSTFDAADLLGMMDEMVTMLPEANCYRARFEALRDRVRSLLDGTAKMEGR